MNIDRIVVTAAFFLSCCNIKESVPFLSKNNTQIPLNGLFRFPEPLLISVIFDLQLTGDFDNYSLFSLRPSVR